MFPYVFYKFLIPMHLHLGRAILEYVGEEH